MQDNGDWSDEAGWCARVFEGQGNERMEPGKERVGGPADRRQRKGCSLKEAVRDKMVWWVMSSAGDVWGVGSRWVGGLEGWRWAMGGDLEDSGEGEGESGGGARNRNRNGLQGSNVPHMRKIP